jgi:hypothetical protein
MNDKAKFDHLLKAVITNNHNQSHYQIVEDSQIFNQSFGTLQTTIQQQTPLKAESHPAADDDELALE